MATHYQTILDRQTQYQYPPEVAAKIAASRQRAQARLAAMQSAGPGEHVEQDNGRDHG